MVINRRNVLNCTNCTSCAQVHELPKRYFRDNWEGKMKYKVPF